MTTRAKLPGLPAPNFADPAVQRWAQAVSERLEVREGARGDPLERVVTWRDLDASFAGGAGGRGRVSSPSVLSGTAQIPTGNGQIINIDMETFAEQLKSTQLYRDLQFSISDPNRFARLGEEVNEFLTRKLTAEAAVRSAQIARTDIKLLEVSRSVAATSTELLAALDTSAAGLRATQFAIATESSATAGQVTTLEARLQVEVNPEDLLPVPPAAAYANFAALNSAVPAASADTRKYYRVVAGAGEALYRSNGSTWNLVGSEESAKLEEVLLVTADKSLGLEAQYTLKVNAGNAIAGFGIAATDRDGVPESAFIIQADKFALSTPFTFSQEATPTATAVGQTWYKPSTQVSYRATAVGTGGWVVYTPLVPFGVDTTTGDVFMSGSLRVGGGSSLTTIESNAANGTIALTAVNDGTTGLATKLGNAVRNVLAGTGGIAVGTINWNTSGVVNSGYGIAITNNGIVARNSALANTFVLDGTTGDATFAGALSAATGTFAGALSAATGTFSGDAIGNINGTAASTVVSGAANGATALTAVNDGTTGLATKLASASRNVLAGSGGLAVGTINWNTSGVVNSGYGIAITANGIVARNSSLVNTFVLDGTTGNATFAGALSAATGSFSGDLITSGQVSATGTTSSAEGTACIVGASATSGVRGGVFIATNTSGVIGASSSGAGVYGKTASTSVNTPGVLGSSGAGGIAIATEVGSMQINSFNSNMIIGTATNTGNNNLVIKEGTAGSRLNDQMLIYGQLSASSKTTFGLVVEQDVEAGTGSFAGLVQLRIHINGAAYKLPLEAY